MPSGDPESDVSGLVTALLHASEDVVIATNRRGRILAWNPGAARTFGYSSFEAVGQSLELIVPVERRGSERAARDRVHQGETIEGFETTRATRDGRSVDLVLRMLPIQGPVDFHGCLEIGRAKPEASASDRVDHAESLLPLITENLSVLISYVDRELRYRLNNSAYEQWFGLRRDEVEGRLVQDVVGPAAWTKVGPRLQEAMTGRTVAYEERVEYARGGTRWIHAVYAPHVASDGTVLGVAVLVDDITERKRVEQSLAESDRRKDEFLAVLAHELRNPLAPLKTALQVVCESSDAHAHERACAIMHRQLAHLSRLVEDLLDVSRITHGTIELRKERVDLAEVVQCAVETSLPLLEQRRHELSIELPPSPVLLHADTVRLVQVFSNLLNNAAQCTDPEGAISLTAQTRGDWVEVQVADNGIGVEPDSAAHLFELFARGERSPERMAGLGVGLSVVRRLVELHGGGVSAHSEGLGRGSVFTVRLPVIASENAGTASAAEGGTAREEGRTRRRVLLIEDNRDARESLSILLRLRGHQIRFASHGAAGIEVAERFRPDAILLDINLPGMDGYEVARQIRERSWGAHLLLVATTGLGQPHDKGRAQEAGFDFHLTKPLDLDLLDLLLQDGPRR